MVRMMVMMMIMMMTMMMVMIYHLSKGPYSPYIKPLRAVA
jgi:hypothetical protein